VNFARDVVVAADPRRLALVALTRDGERREIEFGEVADRAVIMRRGQVVGEVDSVRDGQARILALIMGGDA